MDTTPLYTCVFLPLEDVANVKNINGVMAAGRWYDKPALDDMINE